jgi:NADPH2:quinone reductase
MRALVSTTIGGPDQLELQTFPDPVPQAHEVLVDVKACGVNFPDTLIIRDKYQIKPERPFAPGGEWAGVVVEVGADVTHLKVGDRIAATTLYGGMCERRVVEESACIPIPDDMPFADAASFFLTYATTYYGLKMRGTIKPGETLLILGATGGLGIAAIELGKYFGAKVIAGVSSQDKAEIALKAGADDVLIYPPALEGIDAVRALSQHIKNICGDAGVDVVYDSLGGSYSEAALRAMARYGRLLVIGFVAGIPKLPTNLILLKSCQLVGVSYGGFSRQDSMGHLDICKALIALYQQNIIRPHITAHFPLERGGEAISLLETRQAIGKIVVDVQS